MAESSTTQTTSTDGGRQETGLRKALRKWRERLKRDPVSRSTDSSSPPPPPPPVPPLLFVPTTTTQIHSPADPRNYPPTAMKRLRMARRNTAPADYFAIPGVTSEKLSGSRSRDPSGTREGRSPSSSRRHARENTNGSTLTPPTVGPANPTADLDGSYIAPVNTITTTITATHPQALRRKKSKLRLSFSRPPPVVDTRARAVSANPRSSSRLGTHSRNESTAVAREPDKTADERATKSKDDDSTSDVEATIQESELKELRATARRYVDSDEEKAAVEAVRLDSPQSTITRQKTKQEVEDLKKMEKMRRDEEVLMRVGDVRMGMMV